MTVGSVKNIQNQNVEKIKDTGYSQHTRGFILGAATMGTVVVGALAIHHFANSGTNILPQNSSLSLSTRIWQDVKFTAQVIGVGSALGGVIGTACGVYSYFKNNAELMEIPKNGFIGTMMGLVITTGIAKPGPFHYP